MIENLIKLLKQESVDGFLISESKNETYQLYFVKDKIETVRSGEFIDTSVTIYLNHDEKLGDATFKVFSSSTDKEIVEAIKIAKANALNVFNQPYELVKDEVASFDAEALDLKELASRLAKYIFDVKGSHGAKLNATEIFINRISKRVVNSSNVDKKSTFYKYMIETIPTFDLEKESVEIYSQKNFSSFTEDEIKEYIKEQLFEVEARSKASKIELDKICDVTLRDLEIETLLSEYVYDLNYSSLATKSNFLNIGDKIQKGNGDKITLTMRHSIKGCSESAEFDSDGGSFKDKVIIEEGEVKAFFGGNRFAQYVGQESSGNLPLAELNCGELTKEDLKDKTYLECLQFSGLQVDLLNDYLGGEVRLAILHKDGKEIPVCGFSISGKLSSLISEVKLGKQRINSPSYSGPSFILLKDLTVL